MPEPGSRAWTAAPSWPWRYGDIVVCHYTFADHWFKGNAITDLDGAFVETMPKERRSHSPSTATSPPQWCAGRRGLGRRAVP
jgi:hypothetical protein